MKNISFHEIANIFPLIHGKEFVELKEDIKANGVYEAVVLYDGQILDGRNRFRACQEVGVTPDFVEYEGEDPVGYVLSLNLHRRHLNESQRAMVAANIANLENNHRKFAEDQVTQNEAAEKLNVSERSVNTAKKVQREGSEELIEAVQEGKVSVSAAADIATLPEESQVEVVAKGEKEILAAAKEIRAIKAANIATLDQGGDRKSDQTANLQFDTRAEAAEKLNVSRRSVSRARGRAGQKSTALSLHDRRHSEILTPPFPAL